MTTSDSSPSTLKVIDLRKYTTEDCKVFAGRDRGEYVRKDCGVVDGDRVHVILPEGTMALAAGFPDELLRNTVIVEIEEIGGRRSTQSASPKRSLAATSNSRPASPRRNTNERVHERTPRVQRKEARQLRGDTHTSA